MLYFVVLWRRDGELPLFEVGSLCVAAMLLYSSLPFIGFMVEGLTFKVERSGQPPITTDASLDVIDPNATPTPRP